jgi:hypothetical protein
VGSDNHLTHAVDPSCLFELFPRRPRVDNGPSQQSGSEGAKGTRAATQQPLFFDFSGPLCKRTTEGKAMNDDNINLPVQEGQPVKVGCTCKLQPSPHVSSERGIQIERDPGCPIHGELAEVKRKGG